MDQSIIGFVGLGNMGLPMVRNLSAAGFAVLGYDLDPGRRALLSDIAAADSVDGPCRAAEDCTVMILMLPDGERVRDVLIEGGVAAALPPGALVIDMGSSDPVVYDAVAPVLSDRGIALVDAPVSGSVKGAVEGTLTIMAGGAPAALDRAQPVLAAMGARIFRTGALGSGQIMKALNNLVSAGGLILAIEALLVASKAGLDPAQVNAILNVSTGRNNSTERKIEPYVLSGAYDSGFALSLMAKDVRTAASVAGRIGVEMPLGEQAVRIANDADALLGPGADHTEIARFLEQVAGLTLR